MFKVFIADDERISLRILKEELEHAGYAVSTANDGKAASELLQKQSYHVVILDVQMPYKNGFDILKEIRERSDHTIVILISAYATVASAVTAIKLGADDYLTKPYDVNELIAKISQHLAIRTKKAQLDFDEDPPEVNLFGNNLLMRQIKETIHKVRNLNTTVLITGESGTGKGVIAKEIHSTGIRRGQPFILVDCAAFPPNLIESELFGHEKGAFTSAVATKKGKFELAENGTIFLDEIGNLAASLQSKLLNVLQEKYFYRIGGTKKIPLEARIIAATNENLERCVENGVFREDLYYRLNVVRIEAPPLRFRKDDIPTLSTIFINRFQASMGKSIEDIEPGFFSVLQHYEWPGNIRELENALESAMALCDGKVLHISDLPLRITKSGLHKSTYPSSEDEKNNIRLSLQNQEIVAIVSALEKCGGHREKTAQYLGISRRTLQYKLKKFNLLDYRAERP